MKSAALSWAALCVCPPAILATSVATVPTVKRAVHHATRPHTAAKPKLAQLHKPVQTAAARGGPCDVAPGIPAPALLAYANDLPAAGSGLDDPGDIASDEGGSTFTIPGTPLRFGFGGGGPLVAPSAAVPEPQTWLLMIAGFGFVGMGLRWRRRRTATPTTGGPVAGKAVRRRRRVKATGGLSSLMTGLGIGEAATGSASMATIAAKTMLCVCPTAAIVGSTMTVPAVRTAVYKATAVPAPKAPQLALAPVKPPCDPSLRSAEAAPVPSRVIDATDASPKVAAALLASTSSGGAAQD